MPPESLNLTTITEGAYYAHPVPNSTVDYIEIQDALDKYGLHSTSQCPFVAPRASSSSIKKENTASVNMKTVKQGKHAPGPQDPPATLLANVGGSRKSVLRREVERSIYINPTTFYRNPKATSRGTLLPFGSPTLDIKNERTPLDLR